MSSEAVGRHMPAVVTLDDLTAMMAADGHHRYEISPEAVLSIMPPQGFNPHLLERDWPKIRRLTARRLVRLWERQLPQLAGTCLLFTP